MSLIGSRASFTNRTYSTPEICSECGRLRPAGHAWLVSIRNRICSERCRLNFENYYWCSVSNSKIIVRRA